MSTDEMNCLKHTPFLQCHSATQCSDVQQVSGKVSIDSQRSLSFSGEQLRLQIVSMLTTIYFSHSS